MYIILDRDGVINEDSDAYIKSLAEWQPLPGSIDALARLSKAGHRLAVATNQSGLGRGLFTAEDLEAMHDELNRQLHAAGGRLDGIFHCPHTPDDHCSCRKPLPGLLDAIATELGWPLEQCLMIGDSLRDLEAGRARGCRPILVTTGKGQRTLTDLRQQPRPEWTDLTVYPDLAAVADAVLNGTLS